MEDKEDADDQSLAFCIDLVSLRRHEPFLLKLFNERQCGVWGVVKQICEEVGISGSVVKPDMVVVWLLDPFGDSGYAIILFYDDELNQSFTAHYNKRRLLTPNEDVENEGLSRPRA